MRQKQLLTKLMLLVAIVLMGAGTAWGADETITFSSLNLSNGVQYTTINGTDCTITFGDSGNDGKYYNTGAAIRVYSGGHMIVASTTKTITKIDLTFGSGDGSNTITTTVGTYKNNSWTGEASSVTFNVGGSSGHRRIASVTVTYKDEGSSSLVNNDLALNPTALSFDLYNNSAAQVISYTTSSTGAVTIEDNDYVSFVIDESNKSITVTPKAVTSSTQTITVNQSADETYKAGSATFTVDITDSTPLRDFARINSLDDLTDGAKVILAARYNTNATAYYAMSATTTGKPTGVSFTSITSSNGEIVPENIINNVKDYYWTVGVTSDGYTFTNANNQVLGYSSGTDFVTDGSNTDWVIAKGTADSNALVGEYEGFSITNKNTSTRGIALNNFHNFGAYAVSNYTNASYNFFLDIFVEGVTVTPIPSISAANVDIAYDATEGSIAFTVNNEVAGGAISASTTANWITLGAETVSPISFTCDANDEQTERTATVTLTYTYNTSETVTKEVTITQAAAPAPAVVYTTISDLFDAATATATNVQVTFDSWVVSAVSTNGRNIFVTDNNGNGFVINYSSDQSSTYSVGKVLTGTAVSCSLKLNYGYAQLSDLDASHLSITDGGTVMTASIDMANLAGVNTGALVSYDDLTCSVSSGKYYVSDGTTTIQLYGSLFNFGTLEDGKTYNITGIYQQYNTTKEILPRSAADIVEVVAPSITVDPATADASATDTEGTLALTYENLTISDMSDFGVQFYDENENELSSQEEPDWIMVLVAEQDPSIGEGYVVSYTMDENAGEARTAYFKVFALGDADYVYSNLVTINQAAPVITTTYTLATTITSGKHYVIASGKDGDVKVMGGQNTNNRVAVVGSVDNSTLSVASDAGACEFVIYGPDANGNYTIFDGTGYLYAASSSKNYLRTQSENDDNGKWSISFDVSGEATVVAQGSNTNKFMRFNNTLFSCYSETSSISDLVYFYEKNGEATPTETVTVTAAGYATYCSENALDFTGTGVKAYKATVANQQVSFTEVTKVPAYTGVLLKADAAGEYTVNIASSVDNVEGNAFIGVTEQTTVNETGIFVLLNGDKGVGFYKTTTTFTVGAHTAYLPASVGGARSFIGFDGETTGVNAVNGEGFMVNGPVYDLQGRRVAQPQKGLYIVNGRKVVIK